MSDYNKVWQDRIDILQGQIDRAKASGDTENLMGFPMDEQIKVWENCLLYTSPSPRDRTRSRMPSSA